MVKALIEIPGPFALCENACNPDLLDLLNNIVCYFYLHSRLASRCLVQSWTTFFERCCAEHGSKATIAANLASDVHSCNCAVLASPSPSHQYGTQLPPPPTPLIGTPSSGLISLRKYSCRLTDPGCSCPSTCPTQLLGLVARAEGTRAMAAMGTTLAQLRCRQSWET